MKTNPSCMRLWQINRMALMWTNGTILRGKYYTFYTDARAVDVM